MVVFGKTLAENQKRREIRKRRPMAHVDNGWPHYHHKNGHCLCFDTCCWDPNYGEICKTGKPRDEPKAQHETQSKSNKLRSGKEGTQSR